MIKLSDGNTFESFKYPHGEVHVRLGRCANVVDIDYTFDGSDSIIELMLVVDAIRRSEFGVVGGLRMGYVPFGRQDRVAEEGDCFSLKVFCNLINSMNFEYVHVVDAHSSVTTALIDRCSEITQADVFAPMISESVKHWSETTKRFSLVCPDQGASKKIYELAKRTKPDSVIEFRKSRIPSTGEIRCLECSSPLEHIERDRLLIIVDDICDGGRTFIGIAQQLRDEGFRNIILMVTHGLFTKGLDVFDGLIDEIHTRHGQVK